MDNASPQRAGSPQVQGRIAMVTISAAAVVVVANNTAHEKTPKQAWQAQERKRLKAERMAARRAR